MSSRGRTTRVLLLGWYGSDNTGDEAVLQVALDRLRAASIEHVQVLSIDPVKTARRFGVDALPRNPFHPRTLAAMLHADALVLGGGGLIQDSSSVYNLPLYSLFVLLARLFGAKVIGWGLGVGPLATVLGGLLAKLVFEASGRFTVRDLVSARALASCGIDPERINISADLAFLLDDRRRTPDDLEETQNPKSKTQNPKVGLCLRHLLDDKPGLNASYLLPVSLRHRLGLRSSGNAQRDREFVSTMARIVRLCVEELGADVEFLPLWSGRDDEVLRQVEQEVLRLGVTETRISWAPLLDTPAEVARHVASYDLLISMRLHALIFAANAGVPALGLSYVGKVDSLMETLGAGEWVADAGEKGPSFAEIEPKLRQLWASRHGEGNRLQNGAARLRVRADSDAKEVVRLLG